jgi:tRNA (adenine22-N1)-methyltransferase
MNSKNNRLQLIIDLLEPNSIIADIGTDHGYLPIAALKQKKAKFAYAVDINKQPLNQANKNILKANLEDKIQPILSDGLSYFAEIHLPLDYVVIAGLGSTTIVNILKDDYALIKSYLLCSNTDPLPIRYFIKKKK